MKKTNIKFISIAVMLLLMISSFTGLASAMAPDDIESDWPIKFSDENGNYDKDLKLLEEGYQQSNTLLMSAIRAAVNQNKIVTKEYEARLVVKFSYKIIPLDDDENAIKMEKNEWPKQFELHINQKENNEGLPKGYFRQILNSALADVEYCYDDLGVERYEIVLNSNFWYRQRVNNLPDAVDIAEPAYLDLEADESFVIRSIMTHNVRVTDYIEGMFIAEDLDTSVSDIERVGLCFIINTDTPIDQSITVRKDSLYSDPFPVQDAERYNFSRFHQSNLYEDYESLDLYDEFNNNLRCSYVSRSDYFTDVQNSNFNFMRQQLHLLRTIMNIFLAAENPDWRFGEFSTPDSPLPVIQTTDGVIDAFMSKEGLIGTIKETIQHQNSYDNEVEYKAYGDADVEYTLTTLGEDFRPIDKEGNAGSQIYKFSSDDYTIEQSKYQVDHLDNLNVKKMKSIFYEVSELITKNYAKHKDQIIYKLDVSIKTFYYQMIDKETIPVDIRKEETLSLSAQETCSFLLVIQDGVPKIYGIEMMFMHTQDSTITEATSDTAVPVPKGLHQNNYLGEHTNTIMYYSFDYDISATAKEIIRPPQNHDVIATPDELDKPNAIFSDSYGNMNLYNSGKTPDSSYSVGNTLEVLVLGHKQNLGKLAKKEDTTEITTDAPEPSSTESTTITATPPTTATVPTTATPPTEAITPPTIATRPTAATPPTTVRTTIATIRTDPVEPTTRQDIRSTTQPTTNKTTYASTSSSVSGKMTTTVPATTASARDRIEANREALNNLTTRATNSIPRSTLGGSLVNAAINKLSDPWTEGGNKLNDFIPKGSFSVDNLWGLTAFILGGLGIMGLLVPVLLKLISSNSDKEFVK